MTAKVNILESSQSSALTERLLRRFHDGQNILWISPTRRAATAVRQRLATCLNPLVFSVDELAEEIIVTNDPTAVPLTTTGRRMLLDTVIDQLRSAGELAEFGKVCETRGFLEGIFGLIEELKKLEIWPSRFTRSVECVDSALREKANLCARIYARYQRFLVEHHRFDNEGKIWYAQELLRQGRSRPLENLTQVFVDGFHSFTRSQMEMLSFFRQNVEQITISLLEGEREELFSVPRSTKR